MKRVTYLHAVLTVIAFCLVIISMAVTGLIPAANANNSDKRFVAVPVNADGSLNVKVINDEMKVDITKVNGSMITSKPLPVNIEESSGRNIDFNPLPVKTQH